ncbi:hypothetical protein DA2_0232 [Desulfovibrio sp. A2]|nr:hypothetical protein DA2_0232 [Desulfovibrio sp. A2]
MKFPWDARTRLHKRPGVGLRMKTPCQDVHNAIPAGYA